MHESDNTKIIQDMYEAFGRGDVQTILASVADQVVWQGVYGSSSHVPMGGERRGKPAVAAFFKQVGEHVTFSRFEPKEFVATGDKVIALGHYTATTSAKKNFDSDFAMVFTLENGKVIGFQEFSNSSAIDAAYRAD